MSIGNYYLTRDMNLTKNSFGALVAHREKPRKGATAWEATYGERVMSATGETKPKFPFGLITWELDEPVYVENFNPDDYRS